jgi:hypothetical protein
MFLMEQHPKQKDIWELVVEKAQKWLHTSIAAESVGALEQKARDFISRSLPAKPELAKTCPQGHALSLVSQRDDSAWHCDSQARCVGGCESDGEHLQQPVWRCSRDWRVVSGGTCDFDLCGECVRKNV